MDRRTEEARAREMAGPGGFTLERMLSIMQVLLRDAAGEARATTDARDNVLSADVFMQVPDVTVNQRLQGLDSGIGDTFAHPTRSRRPARRMIKRKAEAIACSSRVHV